MIDPAAAWERLLPHLTALAAERLDRRRAAGRRLASMTVATTDLPPCDISALDGFALAGQAADLEVEGAFPGARPLRIGDLSSPMGGRHSRHRSHRSGRDVDILYYLTGAPSARRDPREGAQASFDSPISGGRDADPGLAARPGACEATRDRAWRALRAGLRARARRDGHRAPREVLGRGAL